MKKLRVVFREELTGIGDFWIPAFAGMTTGEWEGAAMPPAGGGTGTDIV